MNLTQSGDLYSPAKPRGFKSNIENIDHAVVVEILGSHGLPEIIGDKGHVENIHFTVMGYVCQGIPVRAADCCPEIERLESHVGDIHITIMVDVRRYYLHTKLARDPRNVENVHSAILVKIVGNRKHCGIASDGRIVGQQAR